MLISPLAATSLAECVLTYISVSLSIQEKNKLTSVSLDISVVCWSVFQPPSGERCAECNLWNLQCFYSLCLIVVNKHLFQSVTAGHQRRPQTAKQR